ncbi:LLM class flavin-dependent oxidoreductase [Amycolatopsis jejuensis]|uniref:LLM class flavin-dependent oxidoreductase n=1 Tax=Amycolatopsis jejuensis TaxID=330084 RepID=UPI000524EF26|nr:LLM class flavin-dependent oxidoreductase [Amycolatopsis jejuensis]
MDFGLQFTHQLPRPWHDGAEHDLFAASLDQVQLADELGFAYAWVVEQHFLEEYSHSSAPEVFLAAASQRTRRIRLGHAIALLPPGYTHPARMAERIAALDLVSGGRIEFGFGDSKSRMELEGFGIDPALRRDMTLEAAEQIAHMMAVTPYPGHRGRFFTMPARNVVPKPVQKPHPPLWMACSDDASVRLAARLGVGALIHTFFDADEARQVVTEYYETFKRECVPIGHTVNPAVATLEPFYCHESADIARQVGRAAHGFFTYAVRHYYVFGRHRPGYTDVSRNKEQVEAALGGEVPIRGGHSIGTPEDIAVRLESLAAAGVDQTILLHAAGAMTHEQVTGSLRLFAERVLPRFECEDRRRARAEELAPYIEAALKRKRTVSAPAADEVPVCDAYGLSRPDLELPTIAQMPPATQEILLELQRLKALARELDA